MKYWHLHAWALVGTLAHMASVEAASTVASEPCLAPTPPTWTCMRVTVPERYDRSGGRTVPVHIVVARARHPLPAPVAIFFLQGGPGLSGTLVAGRGFVNTVGPLQETHDLVAVDQRGVSGDEALICPAEGPADKLASFTAPVFSAAHAKNCSALFKSKYDLTTFTTATSARDLDRVRQALGYTAVKFVAGGYSSRIVQDYLRLFPGRTASAVLTDLLSMDDPSEIQIPRAAHTSLDAVLKACDDDQPCHTFFPELRNETASLFTQLSHGGLDIAVTRNGVTEPVHITADNVLFWLFGHYHFMANVAEIPWEIHTLMSGSAADKSDLARQIIGAQAALYNYYAIGQYLSVECAEDLAFLVSLPQAEDTITSIYHAQVAAKRAACGEWPHARITPELRTPIHSDVPVLLIVSDLNPVATPDAVMRVGASFSHAVYLRLANHGAGFDDDWNICPKPEAIAFLASNGSAAIDSHCGEHFLFRPFKLG